MMDHQIDILAAYRDITKTMRNLREKLDLPEMRRGGYEPRCEHIADPADTWTRLTELHPSQGWLLFQSRQLAFRDGLPERQAEWGVLLAAEAIGQSDGRSISIAIEQDGCGGWMFSRFTHLSEGNCLCDELRQLVHDPGGKGSERLKYRRYWELYAEQGYLQVAACFMGFESEEHR